MRLGGSTSSLRVACGGFKLHVYVAGLPGLRPFSPAVDSFRLSNRLHPLRIDLRPKFFSLPITFTVSRHKNSFFISAWKKPRLTTSSLLKDAGATPSSSKTGKNMASVRIHTSYSGLVDHLVRRRTGHTVLVALDRPPMKARRCSPSNKYPSPFSSRTLRVWRSSWR